MYTSPPSVAAQSLTGSANGVAPIIRDLRLGATAAPAQIQANGTLLPAPPLPMCRMPLPRPPPPPNPVNPSVDCLRSRFLPLMVKILIVGVNAEKYIHMYGTKREMWISVAEMHFEGAASCWYQSIESHLESVTWEQFCDMVSQCFDRDQHELLLRKLYHIQQTSTIAEYVTSFTTLVDQLTAYASAVDPFCFITRFVDGLIPEIRAIVIVQRPLHSRLTAGRSGCSSGFFKSCTSLLLQVSSEECSSGYWAYHFSVSVIT